MAYTVKAGDTLYGLYGPNWKTLSGYTGDPTKLQIGTQLPDLPIKQSGATYTTSLITNPTTTIKTANPVSLTPDTSSNQATLANWTAQQDQYQGLIDSITKQTEAAQKSTQENQKWYQVNKPETVDVNQIRSDAFSQAGIDPNVYYADRKADLAELQSLNDQYTTLEEQKQMEIAAIEAQPMAQDFITGKVSQAEKNANIRLNTLASKINNKQAIISLKQNDFNSAQSYANTAINQALQVYDINYQQVKDTYTMNQDIIDSMGTQAQQTFTNALSLIEMQKSDEEARMNRAWEAIKAGAQGITLDSTDEEIANAMGTIPQTITTSTEKNIFTQTQLNKGAAAIRVPIAEFSGLDNDTKNFIINNSSVITKMYSTIDEAKTTKEKLSDILDVISGQTSLPDYVKTILMEYAKSVFPKETPSNFKWYNPTTWFK